MTRETNAVPADGFYQGNIIKGRHNVVEDGLGLRV